MAAKAKTKTKTTPSKRGGEYKCPECGRTFSRAAALGAHRRQAHGVIGAVSAARSQRSRATSSRTARTRSTSAAPARGKAAAAKTVASSAPTARRSRQTTRAQTATGTRSARQRSATTRPDNSSGAVNRDALLGALFPNGLPAKEDVLRAANQWLDDAVRLARMR